MGLEEWVKMQPSLFTIVVILHPTLRGALNRRVYQGNGKGPDGLKFFHGLFLCKNQGWSFLPVIRRERVLTPYSVSSDGGRYLLRSRFKGNNNFALRKG